MSQQRSVVFFGVSEQQYCARRSHTNPHTNTELRAHRAVVVHYLFSSPGTLFFRRRRRSPQMYTQHRGAFYITLSRAVRKNRLNPCIRYDAAIIVIINMFQLA